MSSPQLELRAAGETHTGNVREGNEDTLLVEPDIGLYAVLDGMGGHMAGDVASAMARDVFHDHVRSHRTAVAPRDLLAAAVNAASAAVHAEASRIRDRHGMGTTVVCCLMAPDGKEALIAHVGDSRAYLLREGHLRQLTRDHTVVAELIANGALRPEEAFHHPYKSVLSRNLGAKPEAKCDLIEVALQPGDRLLLCSDGLTGFASSEAVEQILGGAPDAGDAARDLVEAALRGGGGDNVTVVVLEAGRRRVPRSTQVIRTSGAVAWWQRRQLFLRVASEQGLAQSPICAVLSPEEAVEIVAGNLCEAIFHDLEQTTGVNVWTYAENLANGWFDQEGSYQVLDQLLEVLRVAAAAVVAEVATAGAEFAIALDTAVTRSFVIAEMAIAGLLAERLRLVEADIVRAQTRAESERRFTDSPTIPYIPAQRAAAPPPDVADCLVRAIAAAQTQLLTTGDSSVTADCLERAHRACVDTDAVADAALAARALYEEYAEAEPGVGAVLDGLDHARALHLIAVVNDDAPEPVKAAALRHVVAAHQSLFFNVSALIIEAGHPISDALQEAAEETARLRAKLGQGEARLARLERAASTRVDRDPDDEEETRHD